MTAATMKPKNRSISDINQIVADIVSAMSLKEKSLIANMNEKSLPYLQYAFDVYISQNIGDDPEVGREVMKQIWQTLQKTHRIRIVGEHSKP
jgi:uncharacterized pyridoxal phosphate-containing UPF0001 family protein